MFINCSSLNRRGAICCCRAGGVSTLLASIAGAGAVIGVSIYLDRFDATRAAAATHAALDIATLDDCLGQWLGNATGGELPPEGVKFLMTLESNGEGGIVGTIDAGEQGEFDVVDGAFDEAASVFSCWIVNAAAPEEAAEMKGAVAPGSMSGSIVAGETEMSFEATKQ